MAWGRAPSTNVSFGLVVDTQTHLWSFSPRRLGRDVTSPRLRRLSAVFHIAKLIWSRGSHGLLFFSVEWLTLPLLSKGAR